MVYISRIQTPVGEWEIHASEQGVTDVISHCTNLPLCENAVSRQAALELLEYFAQKRTEFSVALDLKGTPFQCAVWRTVLQIPYGNSLSYGQVAERLGKPKAVRAVGQAIGRNPCLVLVPCHRVLGKSRELTGFSAGLKLKKTLLDLENISVC